MGSVGKNHDLAVRLNHLHMEVGPLDTPIAGSELIVHDEQSKEQTLPYMLGNMRWPDYPECIGVFRAVRKPTYEELLLGQVDEAQSSRGVGSLQDLIHSGDRWTIE